MLYFVERVLPDLDGRVRDVDGKIVAVSRGLRTDVKRRTPIPALERREEGWLAKIRARVVALLGDTRTLEWSRLPDFRRQLPGWQWSTEKGLAAQQGWTLPELHTRLDAGEVEKNEDGSVRPTGPVNEVIEKLIQRGEVERDRIGRLRRRSGYWATFGFRAPPTPRQMACASLLLEKWPKITAERLAKGLTVEAVVAEEQTAIKRIGDARTDPDKLPFGEKARARQHELDAKLAQLREGGNAAGAVRFWRTEYAAFHNAASTEDQICEECGALFEIGAARPTWRLGSRLPVYCSDACRSKAANRGRPAKGPPIGHREGRTRAKREHRGMGATRAGLRALQERRAVWRGGWIRGVRQGDGPECSECRRDGPRSDGAVAGRRAVPRRRTAVGVRPTCSPVRRLRDTTQVVDLNRVRATLA